MIKLIWRLALKCMSRGSVVLYEMSDALECLADAADTVETRLNQPYRARYFETVGGIKIVQRG